jgi:choline dehydrogenase-like flavoprotein
VIKNLDSEGNISAHADVAIIGGGTAGLILATKLANSGLRVAVVESGGVNIPNIHNPLNDVTHLKAHYSGASEGRVRGLGGTSSKWGGALIPFLEADLRRDWPIEPEEILKYISELERIFSLPEGPYEDEKFEFGRTNGYITRSAKWPSFNKRNVAKLLEKPLSTLTNLEVWVNATVTNFEIADGTIKSLNGLNQNGARLSIQANHFVLAAGAIENTRLLLQLNAQNNFSLFGQNGPLGRYFSDHLSVQIAVLKVHKLKAFNRMVGYRFDKKGTMRNIRFEMANESELRGTFPPHFFHISFKSKEGDGFSALRDVMRQLQNRKYPPFDSLLKVLRSTSYITKAIWWRFIEKRLLIPSTAEVQVHLVMEQEPLADNRITLSDSTFDSLGSPLPEISWTPSENDLDNLLRISQGLPAIWEQSQLASLASLSLLQSNEIRGKFESDIGIFHPTGSTRMGTSEEIGVLDTEMRVSNTNNLSAISTANLPSGAGTNPTMMELLLALRLADLLITEITPDNLQN